MLKKSLLFDFQISKFKSFSLMDKMLFIIQKYKTIASIFLKKNGEFSFKNINMHLSNMTDVGTTQSSITDFYNDIVRSNIIKKEKPIILDIGANIGQFCNASKLFYPSAEVYSFEPDLVIYKKLQRNTKNLSSIKTFNAGLGDKNRKLPFYIHDLSVMSSFKKYTNHDYDKSHVIQLDIFPLDDVFKIKKFIDLIKIDVEGFELSVLKGAKQTLSKTKYLLLELSLDRVQSERTNLELLKYILTLAPKAQIVKFGRPLGESARPMCQDVLIELGNQK